MKKRLLLVFLIGIVPGFLAAQNIQIPHMTPPSPEARNFLKYGDLPVSNHTGVADVNIPVYTIQLKDYTLPVSLSYNTAGIKVQEEASRVGLGWILNAGGIITHTIMGRYQDFQDWAYFNSGTVNKLSDIKDIYNISNYIIGGPKTTLPFTANHEPLYKALYSDKYEQCDGTDLAPDIFQYQFAGYSGKFIFLHTGELVKEKIDNVLITPVKEKMANGFYKLKSWIAVTPDGTEYTFNETEKTTFMDRPQNENYSSTYHLTQIKTAGGSVIGFTYKKSKSYIGSFDRTQDSNLEGYLTATHAAYEVVYLDQITYPGGKLTFEYKFDRQDYTPEARLSAIYQYDQAGVNTSKWTLTQGYFTANATGTDRPTLQQVNNVVKSYSYYNNTTVNATLYTEDWNKKRLKLTRVEHSSGTKKAEVYSFTYNEQNLPTKLSTAIDHWGYHNGANNATTVPTVIQNSSQQTGEISISTSGRGANREPNASYHQAFMLNEVTYPTGGKTKFTYEPNTYKTDDFTYDPGKKDFLYDEQIIRLEHYPGHKNLPVDWVHTVDFTLPTTAEHGNKAIVHIDIKLTLNNTYNSRVGNVKFDMSIESQTGGLKPWSFSYYDALLPQRVDDSNRTLTRSWRNVECATGNYQIKAVGNLRPHIEEAHIIVTRLIYPSEYLSKNVYAIGGGVRVKEINNYDTDGSFLAGKRYNYSTSGSGTDSNTSGRLMEYPRYRKDYQTISSNGLRSTAYSVGYTNVCVREVGKTNTTVAYTQYQYTNRPDKYISYTWWDDRLPYATATKAKDENPPGIPAHRDPQNGLLEKETIYENTGSGNVKQKEITYSYSAVGGGPNIIWGILKNPLNSTDRSTSNICYSANTIKSWMDLYGHLIIGDLQSKVPLGYLYQALVPMHYYLKEKKEVDYSGSTSTETVTTYTHNTTYFYVTKEVVKSQGKEIQSVEYKYPPDLSTNSVMTALKNANRISEPVDIKKTRNGKSDQVTYDYALFSSVPRPSAVKSNTGSNKAMETRITYHNYDSYGNPLYISKDGAEQIVYLWGYTGQYPVAEIRNATYSEVNTALGTATPESLSGAATPNMTLIDGLRAKLPSAQITTYTYKPQTGLLTITDPAGWKLYYVYDEFGRLKETYYLNGSTKKILQAYEYNYSNK
ncbi:MAG: hypothetical protein LUG98_15705 [Tannerellaceae bacterium]|nr:hypothetical protein [Tannerellaceae bacterium]